MLRRITNEYNPAVFNLPWLVARDEGLFTHEGLDVALTRGRESGSGQFLGFAGPRPQWGRAGDDQLPDDALWSSEWGHTRRSHDTATGRRTVVPCMAIVSEAVVVRPGSSLNRPQDMAGRSVAMNLFRGSDYLTLLRLEGLAQGEEIRLLQLGQAAQRFQAMMAGSVDAAILVEPFIALAERQGCRIILETSQTGVETFGPGIDEETLDRLNRALSEATRRINGDKAQYAEYLIAEASPQLGPLDPEDFHFSRFQYEAPSAGATRILPGPAFGRPEDTPMTATG